MKIEQALARLEELAHGNFSMDVGFRGRRYGEFEQKPYVQFTIFAHNSIGIEAHVFQSPNLAAAMAEVELKLMKLRGQITPDNVDETVAEIDALPAAEVG